MNHSLPSDQTETTTRLYHLPAKGIMTPQVESLSGYFARLSRAHCLKPGDLLRRELVWWLRGTPRRSGDWCADTAPLFLAPEMNLPAAASKWIELLQRLTEIKHLHLTSFMPWGGSFPSRWFLKSHHAYCPHCYMEPEGRYERLLWTLEPVSVCPVHRCQLLENCPHCRKQIPMVSFRSLPAHCPYDYRFLGKALDYAPIGSVPESSVELWTARQLAEAISHFQHRKPGAPEYDLAACLRRLATAHKIKDAAEFGRFLGVSRITAWYWLRGQAKPSLTHVVDLCHRFGVNLIDLLEQRVTRHGIVHPVDVPRIPDHPRNKSGLTEAKVKAILRANASNPPSLEALARKLGVYPKLLKKLFPALSRQVMDAYARHHRQYRQEYETRTIQAIRRAAKYLVAEGFLLNRKNLAVQMAKPGVFRWPNIQKAADQIIREMGG